MYSFDSLVLIAFPLCHWCLLPNLHALEYKYLRGEQLAFCPEQNLLCLPVEGVWMQTALMIDVRDHHCVVCSDQCTVAPQMWKNVTARNTALISVYLSWNMWALSKTVGWPAQRGIRCEQHSSRVRPWLRNGVFSTEEWYEALGMKPSWPLSGCSEG